MPLARGDPALLPAGGPRGNPREQAAGPPRAPIHLGAKRGRPAATTPAAKPQLDDLRANLGAIHRAAPTGRRTSARAFGNMVACATPARGAPLRENMLSLPLPSRAALRARKTNRAAPRSGNARHPRAIARETATPPASHLGVRSLGIPIVAPPRAGTNLRSFMFRSLCLPTPPAVCISTALVDCHPDARSLGSKSCMLGIGLSHHHCHCQATT